MQGQTEKKMILITEHGATPREILDFVQEKLQKREVICAGSVEEAASEVKERGNALLLADLTDWTVHSIVEKLEQFENGYPDDRERIIFLLGRYIHNHLSENLSLTGLAELIGISPNYLCTLFHTYAGTTIRALIEKERMEQAAFLLANREMTIYEVAYSVGYRHVSYFCRRFREIYGVSPGVYKERKGKHLRD